MKHTGLLSLGLVAAVLLLGVFSFFRLRSPDATIRGNEMNADRAVFNVTNALTLTGFRLSINVNDYKPAGQRTIFALILCGSLVTLLVGGWGLVRAAGMPYDDWQVLRATITVYALIIVVGAAILVGTLGLWPAIFDLVSSFSNSGHWIGRQPSFDQWLVQLVFLPLGFLGGLGIPVLLDFVVSILHVRRFSRYTTAVLAASAMIFVLAAGTITAFETNYVDDSRHPADFHHALATGSTEVINSRSLGLPLDVFPSLSRPSQWAELLLMLIGANPGGSGGGIGTVVIAMFMVMSIGAMRGKPINRIFGLICLWIAIYLLATLATTTSMIWTQPQVQADRLLFLSVSAIGNAGISHEPLTLTGPSLYVLSGAMLFGRFVPLVMLWIAGTSFMPMASSPAPREGRGQG